MTERARIQRETMTANVAAKRRLRRARTVLPSLQENPATDLRNRLLQVTLQSQPAFANIAHESIYGGQSEAEIAEETLSIIKVALKANALNPRQLTTIADFGAGTGLTTLALTTIAQETNGTVEALENWEAVADQIIASGILPREKVIKNTSGITYLNATEQTDKYNLITAFMLGPDTYGDLFRQLAAAASNALDPEGSLLVTSDEYTFAAAKAIAQGSGSPVTIIPETQHDVNTTTPEILIVPRLACEAIAAQTH